MQQPPRRPSARRTPFTRRLVTTKRSWLPRSAAPFGRYLRSHKRLALASGLVLLVAVLVATLFSQGALLPAHASSVLNNEGLTLDTATAKGSFDTSGNSYSETLLTADGFPSGGTATLNGLTFPWPKVASGSADNWESAGQVLPLPSPTSGTTLGILGAASGGQSSGTATITYTDASTQNLTLTFSDWTLHGGKDALAPSDTLAATMSYRNTKTGHQTIKTYLYETQVTLNAAKTVKSLTLPSTVTGGTLHVFAISVGTPPPGLFNNNGLSNDAATNLANFDGSGNSYSETALSGFGLISGTTQPVLGISFPWPKVASGITDNWESAGQVLPLPSPTSGTTLGILGAAANGQASGTATITYTDSSTQNVTLTFSDWTLHGGTLKPAAGDTEVAAMSYRNTRTGPQSVTTYLFSTSVALDSSKTVQSLTLPSSVTGGQLHVFSFGVLTPSATSDWSMYLGNASRTGFNGAESTITPANVSHLTKQWTTTGTDGITGQPIVVDGQIYWGSWDGTFHDTPVGGGSDAWHISLGVTYSGQCDPTLAGVTSTAAYAVVGGVPTIFIGGGGTDSVGSKNVYIYAVNATSGAILWKTVIGSSPHDFPWSSPVLYNGSLYYGISSFGDCPLVRGRVVQLNATSGAIVNTFYATNSGCIGNGVTSSPAIDTSTGMMYFATGNSGNCGGQSGDYGQSMVEVNANTMAVVASWMIPASQQNNGDPDFLAAPTLFTATIKGVPTKMVGVINKNGIYYAFNAAKVASGPVWEDQLGPGSDCPQCGTAGIAPSAFDGRVLYLGGPAGTINGTSCGGSVQAVNPATGAYLWRDCLSASVLGGVMATPGVVFVNHGGTTSAYNAGTGAQLFSYTDGSSSSVLWGAPTVANGWLYTGNMDGTFYAFH